MKHLSALFLCLLFAGCAAKKPVNYVPPSASVEVPNSCVSALRCDGVWLLTDEDGHLYCNGKLKANLACRGVPTK